MSDIIGPTGPPEEFAAEISNTRTLLLTWQAPEPLNRNGIIIKYVVNITELETGAVFHLVTEELNVTVNSLHPFYAYDCIVAAETIIGQGPFTSALRVEMPEDGKTLPYSLLDALFIHYT